jgi:hypothetical protein
VRSFIPHRCHAGIGVLGAVSVATAALLPGTPAAAVTNLLPGSIKTIVIEHPTGVTECVVTVDDAGQVVEAGKGVVLYMRQEGRGIGLINKLHAYKLQQEQGLDTVEANLALGFGADLRHYGIGAQILADLGVRQIRLLTNNPRKVVGLDGYGLTIVERVPVQLPANACNLRYLRTKRDKLGHLLDIDAEGESPSA